jgi:hypothetical protein
MSIECHLYCICVVYLVFQKGLGSPKKSRGFQKKMLVISEYAVFHFDKVVLETLTKVQRFS